MNISKYFKLSIYENPILKEIERIWRIYIVRTYNKIIKLFQYLPVIWKNEEWDHSYLFILLQYKIKRMRMYHEKVQGHIGWEIQVKDMKRCEELLDNIINEIHEDVSVPGDILTYIKADLLRKKDKEEILRILIDKTDEWWY